MASIRQDFSRTAQDVSRVAQDAAYVAVGLGVVAFQKAQVARRELMEQLEQQRDAAEGPLADVRAQLAKAWKDVDGAIGQLIEAADEALQPVAERLPSQARLALKQAQEARDQFRTFVKEQLAA
jgi:gas vesicle protein